LKATELSGLSIGGMNWTDRMPFLALQLRYTPEQNEKKQTAETEVTDLEEAIGLEEDEEKRTGLKADLDKKKTELVELLASFEVPHLHPGIDEL
jgi:hypothetical protein